MTKSSMSSTSEAELRRVLEDKERTVRHWADASVKLARKGSIAASLVAACRAVGQGAKATPLVALLDEHAAAKPAAARKKATAHTKAVLEQMKRLGAAPERIASTALEALLDGGDASYLLREIARALDQTYASRAALDMIRGAMAIAGKDRHWYEDTHALILISLARFDEASAAIERLAKADAKQAAWLRAYVTALRQPLDYWLGSFFDEPLDGAQASERRPAEVKAAVRAIAGRIGALRRALVKLVGEVAWLPDVRALAAPTPKDFDLADSEGSVPNLMWALRKEWTRLNWLMLALGAPSLGLATKAVVPPEDLENLETMVAARFNLLVDVVEGHKLQLRDQLDKDLAGTRFGGPKGTPLTKLTPAVANIWLDEHHAALASIRWAAGKLDSVFAEP